MSSTQHQLIEQCVTRLRGIIEALDNIHDTSPHRWSTALDDVHSSAESLLAMIKDQAPPSEDQLIAAGLSYPLAKEDAVKLWYSGFRSEVITVLEAWEAIGHDTGINPDKEELLESLRNMAAICNAHGNDMPAQSAIDQRQVIADAITGALAFGAQASQPPAEDHWLRPFYDIGRAEGQRTQELAMLVRMLASSLKRHAPDSNLVARATNYLAAKGLAGTPLRDSSASVEQAGGDERKLSDLGNELHNLSCSIVHENEEWAEQIGGIARELWNWPQARAALAQPSGEVVVTKNESGAIVSVTRQDKEGRLLSVIAESQPSPAQAEKAEAERPIVSFEKYMQVMYDRDENAKRLDAALAEVERLRQFERICEGLPQDAIDGGWTVQGIRAHSKQLEEQLKVALARVAELDKQCRDDVARALGLRPSQERGFAWSYLLASIKSCVKAAEDTDQAQHSVPDDVETFLDEVRAELLRARSKFPGDRIMTIALAEEFGELCKAVLDEPAANVRKEAVQTAVMAARVVLDGDGSVTAWRAERGLDPLAAAPGKEGL
ncbi:hypothetical protein ISD38_17605 [Pseudomonas aeruginosa]|nr:hypothetical protein [Pseudomonas aeruginosa]MBX6172045.1 hypothetical protein [Pseudomonas aeruginosa]